MACDTLLYALNVMLPHHLQLSLPLIIIIYLLVHLPLLSHHEGYLSCLIPVSSLLMHTHSPTPPQSFSASHLTTFPLAVAVMIMRLKGAIGRLVAARLIASLAHYGFAPALQYRPIYRLTVRLD